MKNLNQAAYFIDNQLDMNVKLGSSVPIPGASLNQSFSASVAPDRYLNYRPEPTPRYAGNPSFGYAGAPNHANYVNNVSLVNTGNLQGFQPLATGNNWCQTLNNTGMVNQQNDFSSNYQRIFKK